MQGDQRGHGHERVYDVVIVGGGPAGCVLAARLSEDSDRSVLLVEAGPDYGPDRALWPADLRDPSRTWYDSHPWGYYYHRPTGGEPLHLPRARVLGGSAAINGAFWIRGSRRDYDVWAALGNPGWGFDDLLPYFRRAEADPLARANPQLHGSDGPVSISRIAPDEQTLVERALLEAADELGFDREADMNGGEDQWPSAGPTPKNVADGVRLNPAFTYLALARNRPNLAILPETLVDRALFEGRRAVGVRAADGRVIRGREVVLTSGAYNSPAILLRSGVGPAEQLRELGIPIVQPLPGVGESLMDHPRSGENLNRYIPAPEVVVKPYGRCFVKARSRQVAEDIDLHLYWFESIDQELGTRALNFYATLMYSRSRGSVRLASADPAVPPRIDLNYFSEPADLEAICDGVELARRLAETPPAASLLTRSPDALTWRERGELRDLVRRTIGTTHHPSTTCKMGPASDPLAVVDQAGRVHGVEGLRVADASVFPYSPRANLHFTICAVAEKIADLMRAELRDARR